MKRLAVACIVVWSIGCATVAVNPSTVKADAQTAIQALNSASQLSVQGLNLAKTITSLPPATLVAIQDSVRAFNCALLDDGNTAPMPTGGTVTDSCHNNHAPMLGLLSKLGQVASADTLESLEAVGLAIADNAVQTLMRSGDTSLANAGTVAAGVLFVLRGVK